MHIRAASLEDADAIEAVHYASRVAVYGELIPGVFEQGPGRDDRLARWRRWLENEDIHTHVAESNGSIVGFVTTRPTRDRDLDPGEIAEMPTLYVHPEHWRNGIGAALCDVALDDARGRGFKWLSLWVVDLNVAARDFYKAYGFEEDGTTEVDPGFTGDLDRRVHRYRKAL